METTTLLISQIRTDGATQPRAELNYEVIEEYSQAMRAGIVFPSVIVFYDGSDYWLADGFHRVKAASGAELDRIPVDIRQGTREQAQWFSFGVNKEHGLRRTNADKQRSVLAAMAHPLSTGLSNREIARHVGVEETMVRARRKPAPAVKPHPTAELPHPTKSRRPRSTNEGDGAPTPVTEAGSPAITAPESTGEGDRRPQSLERTYAPIEEAPEEPKAGIPAYVSLFEMAREINRCELGHREEQLLQFDPRAIKEFENAGNKLLRYARSNMQFVNREVA